MVIAFLLASKTSFLKDVVITGTDRFYILETAIIKPVFKHLGYASCDGNCHCFKFRHSMVTLNYLPSVDCLPYKKGNNITEKMKMPAGALPDSFAIRFVYEKGGKQFELHRLICLRILIPIIM